jgi:hypothetical protein
VICGKIRSFRVPEFQDSRVPGLFVGNLEKVDY